MSAGREWLTGVLAALISVLLVGGSLVTAAAENRLALALAASPSPGPTQPPTATPILPTARPGEPTFTPSPIPPTATPTTASIQAGDCPHPDHWIAVQVYSGQNLTYFAQTYQTTRDAIKRYNCLVGSHLNAGMTLYVTPLPTPVIAYSSVTPFVCSPPPAGWVVYIIQPGDTLSSISRRYGISLAQLQMVNCLTSAYIRAGDTLLVPYLLPVASLTPTPQPTHTSSPLPPTPSETPTWIIITAMPPTDTVSPTDTPEPSATETPLPSETSSPFPPTPSETFTPLPTDTALPTSTPTELPTYTPPPTRTYTPTPIP
jgi:LysM repeat protein